LRSGVKRIAREEEEESAFVSMTDMTVSFLFIVMILLAFFASQLHSSDQVPRTEFDEVTHERDMLRAQLDSAAKQVEALERKVDQQNSLLAERQARIEDLTTQNERLESRIAELEAELKRLKPDNPMETYLAKVAEQRKKILESLQARLKVDFPDLQVIVSAEMDALRFKGDGLFKSGESALLPDKKRIVETIASRLNEILPCYTIGRLSSWKTECNEAGAVIEAVQIEGHTDSTGDDARNLPLSTNRANETFFTMTKHEPTLTEYLNSRGQPVISVAGYGKMRPVGDNTTVEGRATNRRIDLRLIMYTPGSIEDIARIRENLRKGASGGAGG
jgi:outer membrane protein OmpA-like peptidoglycan-associated protein